MDELIKTVSEKAGISADQARSAVNSVMDYIKTKLPGLGDQLKGLIAGDAGDGGNVIDSLRKKIGL